MSTAKQDVLKLLKNLPDDASIEDIQYHLYVLDKVRRGSRMPALTGLCRRRKWRIALADVSPNSLVETSE
ncbi:MAG: hypothetical protein WBV46_08405 [Terriglobales bacterium]|jgi:hypothetical protein